MVKPHLGHEQAAATVKYLTVDAESAGQRLDNYLLRILKGAPKSHIYRIIRSGEVRLNKARATADARVQANDVVRVPPVRLVRDIAATHPAQLPVNVPPREFTVLFEDNCFLAIDKPAGVAVHGGSGVSFGVIEQLRRARPQARFLELVHRLDRETSGILLVAKKRSALQTLQNQFRGHAIGKTYLALVLGAWPEKKKVLDQPLHKYVVHTGQGEGERRVKVVDKNHPDGMRALTLVKVQQRMQHPLLGTMTLLQVTIKTGRTHQIRVHLASQAHPIAGDEKYGDFAKNKLLQKNGLERMFLHAWSLRFNHPVSGESMELQAQLPPPLQNWVVQCQAVHAPVSAARSAV